MTLIRIRVYRRELLSVAFLGCVSVIWFIPALRDPTQPIYWAGGEFNDLLVSHLPNALYLKHSLTVYNQIPLWNGAILSGIPFAADPLSGMHYPPLWLTLITNPIPMFNILFLAHMFWAGLGGWLLARDEGLVNLAALLVGVSLTGQPKLIGHIGLGHVSLVYAVSWTPWLLLAVGRAFRTPTVARQRLRGAVISGALLGLVFLIDPRWVLPAGLAAAGYALWLSRETLRSKWPGILAAAVAA